MNEKIFINSAQGDVHAAFDKLQSLWRKISVTDDDLVIFLRGNVDETYIYHLFDNDGKLSRANRGVARDIKTVALKEPYFPQEIYDFLTNLPLCYSITIGGRKYFFCHAGIKADSPLNAQPKNYLLNHPKLKNFYRDYTGRAVIVVGHKSPKKIFGSSAKYDLNLPLKIPGRNILMLDTHAKEDGQLSCVDILSGELWQSDTAQIDSILFVCSGNSCRSPMAKYIMRHLLKQNGLSEKIFVDSAGCNTLGGGFMSKMARDVLREKNIPFDKHISKRFTAEEYRKFKCIIALDEEMLRQAKEISGGDPDNKIRLFTDLDGRAFDVDDPFPNGDYRKTFKEIFIGCSTLLKLLNINCTELLPQNAGKNKPPMSL